MKKTIQALDDLLSAVITLIPTWLGMLKSTRTLAALGTVAIMYFTWKYGGVPEGYAAVIQGIEAAFGISFIGFKTIRSGAPAAALAAGQSPGPASSAEPISSSAPQPTPAPGPAQTWAVPFDPKAYKSAAATAYLRWEDYQDLRVNLNLNIYNPAIRLDIARQIEEEELNYLKAAWDEESAFNKAVATLPVPTPDNFGNYDGNEDYKLQIQKLIPGCQWLPENLNSLIIGYGNVYAALKNIELLLGKPINWYRISTIYGIQLEGLKAVSTS